MKRIVIDRVRGQSACSAALAAAELLDQMRNGRIAGIVVDATYRLHHPAELRR